MEINVRAIGYALRGLKGEWLIPEDKVYAITYLESLIDSRLTSNFGVAAKKVV